MGDIGPAELRLMQGLAQQVTALRPELLNGDATIGELAWGWAKDVDTLEHSWRHRMWFDENRLAGWGWVQLPHRIPRSDGTVREVEEANLIWQVHPDRPELLSDILDWYDEVANGHDQSLTLQSGDTEAIARTPAHGYVFDAETGSDNGSWIQFNVRELDDVPDPVLPTGFRFVTAEDVSVAAAAEAHRDAWPLSAFSETSLARVQRTWPYRADLHVLVEAPDGTLVATAIMWFDTLTRTAEFEPVGTHRDFRRQGLGAALQLHGMRLAKAAGATRMLVACQGGPANPATKNLYFSVGFRELSRDVPQIKPAK